MSEIAASPPFVAFMAVVLARRSGEMQKEKKPRRKRQPREELQQA
jgi:hypothetical protein